MSETLLEKVLWATHRDVSVEMLESVPNPNEIVRTVWEDLERGIRRQVLEAHLFCRELGKVEWPASAWEAFKDRLYHCRFTGWFSRRWPVKRQSVKLLEWWPDIKVSGDHGRYVIALINEAEEAEDER